MYVFGINWAKFVVVRGEIDAVRNELAIVRFELGAVREELVVVRGEFAGVRFEFAAVRGELVTVREEFAVVRGESAVVRDESAGVRGEWEVVREGWLIDIFTRFFNLFWFWFIEKECVIGWEENQDFENYKYEIECEASKTGFYSLDCTFVGFTF